MTRAILIQQIFKWGIVVFYLKALLDVMMTFRTSFTTGQCLEVLYCSVFLFYILKIPVRRDTDVSYVTLAVTMAHVSFPLVFTYAQGEPLSLTLVSILLGLGTLLSACAVLDLRESFGILPGNHDVVSRGLYSLLRHPIYLGYVLVCLGALVQNWSFQSLMIFCGLLAVTYARIVREEGHMKSSSPDYGYYCSRVRYRLVPGVF